MYSLSRTLAGGLLAATALVATAQEQTFTLNIPAQPLSSALEALGQKTGIHVFYAEEIIQGKTSPALSGNYSAQQAIEKLLAGSGLIHTFTASDTVAIKPAPVQINQSDPTALPAVKVVGKAEYDVTDPYNQDYVLPNATAGTKTDTPIMETPLNVQVVSKQVLKDQQVITLGQALKNVSGVVVNSSTSTTNYVGSTDSSIILRGFTSQTYFRNGFRLQQGAASRQFANVESVEVLKGPAAILYGLVEPGGMVNVTTKQPLATPYYAAQQQFGSYDLFRTTIDATGPLTKDDTLLYRLNASYQNSGSYQDFVDQEDFFIAPVLKWNISPRTQATVELEYNRQHQGQASSFDPFIGGKPLHVPLNTNYGEYSPAITETFFGGANWSHQFNDDWSIKHSFSVNQQAYAADNYVRPAYAISDSLLGLLYHVTTPPYTGLGVLRSNGYERNQDNTYATNLDLTGHFDTLGLKHTLLLGGDYYRLNHTNQQFFDYPHFSIIDPYNPVHPGIPVNVGAASNYYTQQQTDQYGLYAQDQIKLPYNLHVTGGIRYQYIHQDYQNDLVGVRTLSKTVSTNDAVTPRVGILWHPQNWISLYANYAESFGANTGTVWAGGQLKPIAPTSAEQYEGGIKLEFFDGRLRANLGYYDLTKTNVAVGDPDPAHDCGSGPKSCSIALGGIRSRGPELDIQGEILPGWNAITTWSNTDILITKTNADNAALSVEGAGSFAVGSRLPNVPRNTASFWSTYEFQDTALKGLKFGGGVTVRQGQIGTGGQNLFAGTSDPAIKTPGYATLGLLTAYSHAVGKSKVTLQLNIDNLLDKRYYQNINSVNNTPGLGGLYTGTAEYGVPRTFMGSLKIEY